MSDSRTQFTFYESFYLGASNLIPSLEDRALLYEAVFRFALYGEEPEISGPPAGVFAMIRPNLEASRKKSKAGKTKREQNGNKSRSNKSKSKKEQDKEQDIEEGKGKDKEQMLILSSSSGEEKESKAARPPASPRFVPPTEAEVRDYCLGKGYSVDPEAFVAFYASKGWKVGSQPMKDWRAALVTWQKREESDPRKGKPAPQPAEISYADLDRMFRAAQTGEEAGDG